MQQTLLRIKWRWRVLRRTVNSCSLTKYNKSQIEIWIECREAVFLHAALFLHTCNKRKVHILYGTMGSFFRHCNNKSCGFATALQNETLWIFLVEQKELSSKKLTRLASDVINYLFSKISYTSILPNFSSTFSFVLYSVKSPERTENTCSLTKYFNKPQAEIWLEFRKAVFLYAALFLHTLNKREIHVLL